MFALRRHISHGPFAFFAAAVAAFLVSVSPLHWFLAPARYGWHFLTVAYFVIPLLVYLSMVIAPAWFVLLTAILGLRRSLVPRRPVTAPISLSSVLSSCIPSYLYHCTSLFYTVRFSCMSSVLQCRSCRRVHPSGVFPEKTNKKKSSFSLAASIPGTFDFSLAYYRFCPSPFE